MLNNSYHMHFLGFSQNFSLGKESNSKKGLKRFRSRSYSPPAHNKECNFTSANKLNMSSTINSEGIPKIITFLLFLKNIFWILEKSSKHSGQGEISLQTGSTSFHQGSSLPDFQSFCLGRYFLMNETVCVIEFKII